MADYVRVPETDWQNILDAVRGKTGGAEKMLSGVVAQAIASIEAGGGGGSSGGGESSGASGMYMAKITPAENVWDLTVTHNLGTTDILLAACFVEKLDGEAKSDMQAKAIAKLWAKTEIPVRMTSTTQSPNYEIAYPFAYNNGDYKSGSGATPNSEEQKCKIIDTNTFVFARVGPNTGQYYHPGFTYTVIIMVASAFKEMEG